MPYLKPHALRILPTTLLEKSSSYSSLNHCCTTRRVIQTGVVELISWSSKYSRSFSLLPSGGRAHRRYASAAAPRTPSSSMMDSVSSKSFTSHRTR